jgi:hypothetical protein
MQTLLKCGSDAKNSQLSTQLWMKDTTSELDDVGRTEHGIVSRNECGVNLYFAHSQSHFFDIDFVLFGFVAQQTEVQSRPMKFYDDPHLVKYVRCHLK